MTEIKVGMSVWVQTRSGIFTKYKIVGETSRSWVVGWAPLIDEMKIPKKAVRETDTSRDLVQGVAFSDRAAKAFLARRNLRQSAAYRAADRDIRAALRFPSEELVRKIGKLLDIELPDITEEMIDSVDLSA